VLAGVLEVDEGEEEELTEVWKVAGVEDIVDDAGSVSCAKDEVGRTMERKRSVEENGSDLGHWHVAFRRLESISR
jgi:hypothetical protein